MANGLAEQPVVGEECHRVRVPREHPDRLEIAAHIERPTFGFLGHARVNVLELNLAMDEAFGPPAALANDTAGK